VIDHRSCRPPAGARVVARLNDRTRWVRDNGEPARAFIGFAAAASDDEDPIVWVATCQCTRYLDCVRAKAMNYAAECYGSATIHVRRALQAKKT